MRDHLRHCFMAISITIAATTPGLAAPSVTADGETDDVTIAREIESLRAELAELRASMSDGRVASERAASLRTLIEDVLADVEGRSSFQSTGATAGWNDGFFIASADAGFKLNIRGYTQFRWIINRSDGVEGDRWQSGFENARTQLFFDGSIFDPSLTYMVQGNFSRAGGGLDLFDAWIAKSFESGWKIVAGQFRDPMLREFLVVETVQLAVDRSLVHQAFSFDRTQGVLVEYRSDLLRVQGSFNDGARTSNSGWSVPTTEYAFTGRAELRFGGSWAQFADFTSRPGEPAALMLGAALGWQRAESGSASLPGETLQWTVDASAEFGGANLFGAVVGRHVTSTGGADLDQYGALVQGGWFLAPTVEPYGRYEWGDADDDGPVLSVLTVGANWYVAGPRLKLSADVGYAFDGVAPFFGQPSSIVGWRADPDDGELVIRTQAQIRF